MANTVIKRDGTKEPFDAEKIKSSIRKAAQEAGLEPEKIESAVQQASQAAMSAAEAVEEIATSDLKNKVLATLDTVEPSVSQAWRNYEATKGQ